MDEDKNQKGDPDQSKDGIHKRGTEGSESTDENCSGDEQEEARHNTSNSIKSVELSRCERWLENERKSKAKQQYNYRSIIKNLKDKYENEISGLQIRLTQSERNCESESFSLNLSKQEVKLLKDALLAKEAELKEERAKLKSQHKEDLKRKSDDLSEANKQLKAFKNTNAVQEKSLKTATERLSSTRLSLVTANKKSDEFKKRIKELERLLKKCQAKVDDQLQAKLDNAVRLEELKLSQVEAKAKTLGEENKLKQEKSKEDYFLKTELMKFQSNLKAGEKKKDSKQKRKRERRQLKGQKKRMKAAQSAMMRTARASGGMFPNARQNSIDDCIDILVQRKLQGHGPTGSTGDGYFQPTGSTGDGYFQTTMTQMDRARPPTGWTTFQDASGKTVYFNPGTKDVAFSLTAVFERDAEMKVAARQAVSQSGNSNSTDPSQDSTQRTTSPSQSSTSPSQRESSIELLDSEVTVVGNPTTVNRLQIETHNPNVPDPGPTPGVPVAAAPTQQGFQGFSAPQRAIDGTLLPFVTPQAKQKGSQDGFFTQPPSAEDSSSGSDSDSSSSSSDDDSKAFLKNGDDGMI